MEPDEGIESESNRIVELKNIIIMSGIPGDPFGIGGGEMPRLVKGGVDVCLNLIINTNLASVVVDVLDKTTVGDILPVEAQSVDGPVVVLKDGEVLGTVLSSHLVQLLNCMNGGTNYVAKVIKIEDAICQVKISAVK